MNSLALTQPLVLSPVSTNKRVLSRPEAATYCGVSNSTFDRAVKRGDLPAPIRVGRRRLWKAEALDSALDRLAGSR
jgi:excisionase family DNA binding protein